MLCICQALLRGSMICMLLLMLTPLKGFAKRGGYMRFQFQCYNNPGHLDVEGYQCDHLPSWNCDPYFIICISNQPIRDDAMLNCPVYSSTTVSYDNADSVCNSPSDNRGELAAIKEFELPYPLQETYYIRIIVKDSDGMKAHQTIATFVSAITTSPSPNNNQYRETQVYMRREESRIKNPMARLTISVAFKCDWNLYGNLCLTFCRALPTDNYVCSDQGAKVCKSGWIGPECSQKELCQKVKCVFGGTCIYVQNVPMCSCKGIIGPHCYADYNPCHPNPCGNGGKCVSRGKLVSDGISCDCLFPYHGAHCQTKFNLCEMDPCHNNGSCAILRNGTHKCTCPSKYEGLRCERRVLTTLSTIIVTTSWISPSYGLVVDKKVNFGLIFGCLFGLLLCIVFVIAVYFVLKRQWRGPVKSTIKEKPLMFKQVSVKSAAPCNEYGECQDDSPYDTIDERETYVYQVENNDDYLVPSRPTTPAISVSRMSINSGHVSMLPDEYDVRPDHITDANTRDNEYFPSLPTRTPRKNPIQQFFNFMT